VGFEILEGFTSADAAFRATGSTAEEAFMESARALLAVMMEDPSTVAKKERVVFTVTGGEIDLLLFSFLNELLFYKDSARLLLRPAELAIEETGESFSARCAAEGETIDMNKHVFSVDVKSVTLHRLSVKKTNQRWSATVVLDV